MWRFGWVRGLGDRRPRPASLWRVVAPLAGVVTGLLIAASAQSANGTDLRAGRLEELSDLIRKASTTNKETEQRNFQLQSEVTTLSRSFGRRNTDVARAESQVAAVSAPAGLEPVTGSALTVTLNDAPPGVSHRPGIRAPSPDDLVVHQQDVQAVVNALWTGGARAVQVMDQRLVSTSAVRCVGNTLILQGRVYSPPYRITAVGDTGRLQNALDASEAVGYYREAAREYRLGYQVERSGRYTIAGYAGSLELRYARPAHGAADTASPETTRSSGGRTTRTP